MAYRVPKVVLKWNGPAVSRAISVGVKRGVEVGARIVRDEALRLILDTAKSGRIYGTHQASAPGEAPASQYGDLIAGFTIELTGNRAIVRNRAPHGPLLERGTQRMAPRPFMAPAAKNTAKRVQRAIGEEIRKETKYYK